MEIVSSLFNNENLAIDQHPVPEQEMFEVNRNEENNKRRKRESKVWEEMTKSKGNDGQVLARCTHCQKAFDGSSKKGTTHLKNHLERCRKKRKGGEDAQKSIRPSDLTSTDVIKKTYLMNWIKNLFDEKGYPTEDFEPSLLNSRKVDILEAYQEEKDKLRKFFSQLSCRISLRIEYFYHFTLVMANYIDENWKQNTTLIGVLGSSSSLIEAVKDLCLDLKIDGNICSVVFHGYVANFTGEINRWFAQQGSLPFGGCRVFDVEEFCDWVGGQRSFWRIEDCIAYVHRTPSNQSNFEIAVNNVKSMRKKLASEPLPTTHSNGYLFFQDIEISLLYKEAFFELERMDTDFKSINLTREQWDEATALVELGKSMRNITSLFDYNSTTPNMYFSKFCDFHMKLLQAERSSGYLVGENNSSRLLTGIDKYWSRCNLVLVMTVILDPRFKMEIVQLWYNEIYGCDADLYLEKIIDDFKKVYNEYAKRTETSSISYLDAMGRPCSSSHNVISPK